ncbi:hypothetical protein FGRMN_811 [Fusarium graminum]|nr:hypothetical protein FGRMN_811 [Fusarium graminum]
MYPSTTHVQVRKPNHTKSDPGPLFETFENSNQNWGEQRSDLHPCFGPKFSLPYDKLSFRPHRDKGALRSTSSSPEAPSPSPNPTQVKGAKARETQRARA